MNLPMLVLLTSLLYHGLVAGHPQNGYVGRLAGVEGVELASIERIVLPPEAQKILWESAEDLRFVLDQRYGSKPRIIQSGARHHGNAIYFTLIDPEPIGQRSLDHYTIRRIGTRIYISASSAAGISCGVYGFCSDFLGARWYWDGPLGFELIGSSPKRLIRREWQEAPDYVMRRFYPSGNAFNRRNRLNNPYNFNHALAKVFTPARFAEEPDLFSTINGEKRPPRGNAATDPQPDFTNPRVVALAAEAAANHFKAHPEAESFSLSINDNALFDETDATRARIEPVEYFRNRPNYTDLVFDFVNAVAERVFADPDLLTTTEGQPRYLTALAYYWTEQAPSFDLHPRVMPVLTSDRAQWHDPDYRLEDKDLIKRWNAAGSEVLATWDYYFGAPFPYPRQFTQFIAESIPYMQANGVQAFFSQLPAIWGMDGAKAWLATQLLWDSSRDADALLEEYYTHFFGAAADPIRSFFERAEARRISREGPANWIKFYKDESGIELFSATFRSELRDLLTTAKNAVETETRYAARVGIVSEAFYFTEMYAEYHEARRAAVDKALALLKEPSAVTSEARQKLYEQLLTMREKKAAYENLMGQLLKKAEHRMLGGFKSVAQSDPSGLILAALALGADDKWATDLSKSDQPLYQAGVDYVKTPHVFRSVLPNVDLNYEKGASSKRNFLGPEIPSIPGWSFNFRPAENFNISTTNAHGDSVIRMEGADMVSCSAEALIFSRLHYMLEVKAAYKVSPDNRVVIRLTWSDFRGERIRKDYPFRFPTGESDGYQTIRIPLQAPVGAERVGIRIINSRQYEGDFLELDTVDFGMLLPK